MNAAPQPPGGHAAGSSAAGADSDLDHLPQAQREAADMGRITDPRLLRALDWWHGLVAASAAPQSDLRIPDRALIDPAAITDLLPYCILWDVVHGPEDKLLYRCRLAGTMLDQMRGGPSRSPWLHERFGAETALHEQDHSLPVLYRRPFMVERRMSWVDKPFYKYRRLMLPFTHRAAVLRQDSGITGDPDQVALLVNVISFVPE